MSAVYELPPEPPAGTIVLDALGRAVQRRAAGWFTASRSVPAKDWAGVLAAGPLTVVHAPEGAEVDASPRILLDCGSAEELLGVLRKAIRVRGGNVQVVLGSER